MSVSFLIRRILSYALLMILFNFYFLSVSAEHLQTGIKTAAAVLLALFFLLYNIIPYTEKDARAKALILRGGYELILASGILVTIESAAYISLLFTDTEIPGRALIINAVIFLALLIPMLINGILRLFFFSGQLGIPDRIALILFWWVPGINFIILNRFMYVARNEYTYTVKKHRLNKNRKKDALCKTKYPLFMVHGIFFRDWKQFKYWGRIADELIENGATVYYGCQQSSAGFEQTAAELAENITKIVNETGCGKVNIIAHSKGGLDCRYAISRLGMDKHTASLTTINTPHFGCNYVGAVLDKMNEETKMSLDKKYKAVFTKLGDDAPDFLTGLQGLSDKECAAFNEQVPDAPGVLYQSVASKMRSALSAGPPLNIGYAVIKRAGGGDNDGLVSVDSMKWGNFLGVLSPKGTKGISHGDVIDLTRKNIKGFDVCEFYVDLVNKLKEKGL